MKNKRLRTWRHHIRRIIGTQFFLQAAAQHPTRENITRLRNLLRIQLSAPEILTLCDTLRTHCHCRLLVFGAGLDSTFWFQLNKSGTTLFLEDNHQWLERAQRMVPTAQFVQVTYGTRRDSWKTMLDDVNGLAMDLPEQIRNVPWNIILVDGPRGYEAHHPGRMKSIYEAARLSGPRTDVFIHDCDREVERHYCDRFFSSSHLVNVVQRMRHYRGSLLSQRTIAGDQT